MKIKRMFALVICMILLFSGCAVKEENLAKIANKTAKVLMDNTKSSNGEWIAFGLARWDGEVPQDWFAEYYANVEQEVAACAGVLHDRKYTEYSRTILALTAMGKDPANAAGYNLLLPLADFDQTVFQGVNGAVFALLALDSGNYEIPLNPAVNTQATREMYVDYILNAQMPEGGWSLSGDEVEVDLTAMTLQALAKYRNREDVEVAIEKGLAVLSTMQNENGRFTAFQAESSESIAQTIVALTELGIAWDDPRFVKNGNTLVDALLEFRQKDGGFAHLLDGNTDLLATVQAFYAMVALERAAQGEASLYTIK